MLPKDIKKTNDIAKLPILVKQVIRRFKTFTLIAKELPISLLNNLDVIIVIRAALTNLQSPIYKYVKDIDRYFNLLMGETFVVFFNNLLLYMFCEAVI